MPLTPLFPLGHVVSTPGAAEALNRNGGSFLTYLARHSAGDWGDIDPDDANQNDRAVAQGGRLFSAYFLPDRARIWVITEADRSVTTFLLPAEY